MEQLIKQLQEILKAQPQRVVLSAKRANTEHTKATIQPKGNAWQIERFTQKQAFHQNITSEEFAQVVENMLKEEFTQLTALTLKGEYRLKISKKGKLLFNFSAASANEQKAEKFKTAYASEEQHNRKKEYLLAEGLIIPPLVDMGIFTPEGRVVASMHAKYRQISRFIEMIDDELRGQNLTNLRVIDFGCGKSYLTFVLYYYLRHFKNINVRMTGLDLKKEVVEKCQQTAEKYAYTELDFEVGDIGTWHKEDKVDMVVALHACDTATDHAIAGAVRMGAQFIFSVPCCQHELNTQMQSEALPILSRYGIVKERTAALMTDAIRGNLLTASGYKTQLLEFVDLANTPKNILIRAHKANIPKEKRVQAIKEVKVLCEMFGFQPSLEKLLRQAKVLADE